MSFVKKAWGGLSGSTTSKKLGASGERLGEAQIHAGQKLAGVAGQALGRQADTAGEAERIFSRAGERAAGALSPYGPMGGQLAAQLQQDVSRGPLTQAELMQTPGVQFRLGEAQKALERGASARGLLLSGGHKKDLGRYMQDLASQEYGAAEDQRLRRLQSLQSAAGLGLQGAQAAAGLQERLGSQQASLRQDLGAAQAAQILSPAEIEAQSRLQGVQSRELGRVQGAQATQGALSGMMGAGGAIAGGVLGGPMGASLAGNIMSRRQQMQQPGATG